MTKAISLSGGGDKGAFTVGVLKKLTDLGNHYDMISGTSTGALIAPFFAAGEIDLLRIIYTTVNREDIIKTQYPLRRLIYDNSLYDVSPLRRILNTYLTNDIYDKIMNSGTDIFISTVCLNNGVITYFTNSDKVKGGGKYDIIKWQSRSELIHCIMASSVQPVLMPPENIKGQYYVDGGLREYLPAEILIDAGAESITGIMTTKEGRYYDPNDFSKATDILLKTIEIFSNDVSKNDLRIAKMINDGIKHIEKVKSSFKRFSGLNESTVDFLFESKDNPFYGKKLIDLKIIRPERDLGDGLTFDTEKMKDMYRYGYGMELS